MSDSFQTLLQLQGLDRQIFHLRKSRQKIPEQLARWDGKVGEAQNQLKAAQESKKEVEKNLRHLESRLAEQEHKIRNLESKQREVKTNKEFAALKEEIGAHESDRSRIEDAILEAMDAVEKAESRIASCLQAVREIEADRDQNKAVLDVDLGRVEEELGEIESRREVLAAGIDAEELAQYERLLHGLDGKAMAAIVESTCQGCYYEVNLRTLDLVMQGNEMVFCSNCGRILFVEERVNR